MNGTFFGVNLGFTTNYINSKIKDEAEPLQLSVITEGGAKLQLSKGVLDYSFDHLISFLQLAWPVRLLNPRRDEPISGCVFTVSLALLFKASLWALHQMLKAETAIIL